MDIKTQAKVCEIVRKDLKEILEIYLAKNLATNIRNEIMAAVEWDLGNMEEDK